MYCLLTWQNWTKVWILPEVRTDLPLAPARASLKPPVTQKWANITQKNVIYNKFCERGRNPTTIRCILHDNGSSKACISAKFSLSMLVEVALQTPNVIHTQRAIARDKGLRTPPHECFDICIRDIRVWIAMSRRDYKCSRVVFVHTSFN